MKRVLMVAYHFPPLAGSSGIQRTLRFAQHLPRYGWHPMVLTVTANAYEHVSTDLLREVPERLKPRRIEIATPGERLNGLQDGPTQIGPESGNSARRPELPELECCGSVSSPDGGDL